MPAPIAASKVSASPLGARLRYWRVQRRLSQLELALLSGVSARHLSCAETGRARPSREVVHALAAALDLPLRERNALLMAAGFAPAFQETALGSYEFAPMRQAIDLTLNGHDPFPAFAFDGSWNVLQVNRAMVRVFGQVRPGGPKHANVVRQVLDRDDMRPYIENWAEVAWNLLAHVEQAALSRPSDAALQSLLAAARTTDGLPPRPTQHAAPPCSPVMVAIFRAGDRRLRFFSTLTRFMAAADVGLEEVGVECLHPVDDETRCFCRELWDAPGG
jgi:transcriptional regulator with XRE-family HTH domain